ncbi:SusE domain-containing protein [uncultured Mucilaginibacter sp.]|uniref:SusE domain-containing protein n=1 Tax=uncultured Mucilaginibacter sp. TaxID=797541 RepID=UPI0025D05C5B|nr:SusE domain-containing protein [uncultured Mucilaginibacter sp.]
MKKVLSKFIALSSIGLLMLSACKKDGTLVTSNGGKAGSLTASSTTLMLDKTKLTDTSKVIKFSFTSADYGFSAAVTNTLQIDAAGDNWAKPTSVTLGNKVSSQGYSTVDFNNLVLKLNLPAGVASTVNVRIMHSISSGVAPVYSNVLALSVTPFNLTSWLYITGASFGWQNPGPQEDSLISVTGNGVYTGIVNFTDGNNQFLVLPAKNWNNKYATTGNSTPSTTITYNASNNLNAPTAAGWYIVTVDLNANTVSFALADFYSIIGDAAQGWGTDVPMKYVNDGNGNWVATTALVSTGSFKVRRNDDWSNSWGIPKAGSAGAGVPLTLNNTSNDNISIASSGNYVVTFNAPATAFGSPALVTTTYTLTKQ